MFGIVIRSSPDVSVIIASQLHEVFELAPMPADNLGVAVWIVVTESIRPGAANLVDQGQCIVRNAVAAPGDVAVGRTSTSGLS